ncbi:NIPSNAP family protein [Alteromonadaceae bacterium BrNp21-10]|nr:NIPSNAP family protein [Alteromonadaceae bacterium BrNp21-10]
MKKFYSVLISLVFFVGFTASAATSEDSKIFEMRTYTTYDGKLDNLLSRFRDHTMTIFEKHDMQNIGYWIPEDQENTLIYIIAHNSKAAAEQSWKAFIADPQWQAAYTASIADGKLVSDIESVFMHSTDFSPLK